MIIELHLLQSFPASALNRDDTDMPKSISFGGCERARISSQCLKRSARLLFNQFGLDASETGVRTKRLLAHAVERLADSGREADAARDVVAAGLRQLGFGLDKQEGQLTEYLLFVGGDAVEHLADYCDENWTSLSAHVTRKTDDTGGRAKKPAKTKPNRDTVAHARRILDASRAADVALFGRMIADNKDFNVDAASQVAHAISTHAVASEIDFYTAVDDLKPGDESGADMLGGVDLNAACYYRYLNLDTAQLAHNLRGDDDLVARAARAWLYAFVHAVPSGKQNSTAARTLPDTLLGVVREHGAWSLANAFLKPVTGTDIMTTSTTRLLEHFTRTKAFYGDSSLRTVTAASITTDLAGGDGIEAASDLDDFADRMLAGLKG